MKLRNWASITASPYLYVGRKEKIGFCIDIESDGFEQ